MTAILSTTGLPAPLVATMVGMYRDFEAYHRTIAAEAGSRYPTARAEHTAHADYAAGRADALAFGGSIDLDGSGVVS